MSVLHIAANIFHKITCLLKPNVDKPVESEAIKKLNPQPEPSRQTDEWKRAGDSIVSVLDVPQSSQRFTLRYSHVGKSRMGVPVHIFSDGNGKIEVGIVPDFKAPHEPFVLFVKGLSSSATVFLNNREASLNRSKHPRPAYPLKAVCRPSVG